MRILFFLFLALAAILTPSLAEASGVAAASDGDLTKAFRLAYEGDLTDGALVRGLEVRFGQKRSPRDRVLCAYLLTFSPRRLLSNPRSEYIEFVINDPKAKEILGEDSLFRLYRIRGDEAYDDGKFELSVHDHKALLRSQDRMLRDYAILKVGWGYLNLKRSSDAYHFWLENTEKALQTGVQNVSPNLLHGLALALVEDTERTAQDIDRLGKLNLDNTLKQEFIGGIEEGLDSLTKESDQQTLAHQIQTLSWRPELLAGLFERSKLVGKRACRLIYWLEAPGQTLDWATQGRIMESCAQWAGRAEKDQRDSGLQARLETLLPRYDLHGSDRRVRFEWYRSLKRNPLACTEGISWLSDKIDGSTRKLAPVKEINQVCTDAAPQLTSTQVAWLMDRFQAGTTESGYLSAQDEPLLFILTSLLSDRAIRDALVTRLQTNPAVFKKTLVPSLLAENLRKHKESTKAAQLLALYGEQADGQIRTESIWQGLLTEKLMASVSAKNYADALTTVEKTLPIKAERKLTEPQVEMWLSVIVKAKDDAGSKDRASKGLQALVASGYGLEYRKLTGAILELCGQYHLWGDFWTVLKNNKCPPFSEVASEKLKLELFEAIASNQWRVPETEKNSDPEFNFLVQLASSLKEPANKIAQIEPVGKSVLAQDLKMVKAIDKKRQEVLGPKLSSRDRITQVTTWVQFLDRHIKQVERRLWSSTLFYRTANSSLADFCGEAKTRLSTMTQVSKHKADSVEQWEQFAPVLVQRLDDCEKRRNL